MRLSDYSEQVLVLGTMYSSCQRNHRLCRGWLLLEKFRVLIALELPECVLKLLDLEKRLGLEVLDLLEVRGSQLLYLTLMSFLEAGAVQSLCLLLLGPLSPFLCLLVLLLLDLYLSDVFGGSWTFCVLVGVHQFDGERRDVLEGNIALVICGMYLASMLPQQAV